MTHREKLLEVMRVLWPRGIPTHDYEAVLMFSELVAAVGKPPPREEKTAAEEAPKRRRRRKTGEASLYGKVIELVKSKRKPVVLSDVVEALGLKKNRASGILYAAHKKGDVAREGERGSYAWRAP
jgi:hypothetical protein